MSLENISILMNYLLHTAYFPNSKNVPEYFQTFGKGVTDRGDYRKWEKRSCHTKEKSI